MAIEEELQAHVSNALTQKWEVRDGTVVPETDDVLLSGGGRKLEATMLYADLADSTGIALYDRRVASRLFKAFLSVCSRLIRYNNGYVRSFDGDRVMGVFLGDSKNNRSAVCGLNIAWAVSQLIKPRFDGTYEAFKNGTYSIQHCVGIDSSEVMVVRAGIVKHNDLVWVGRAPNIAAKLSSMRNFPNTTYITENVYNSLRDGAKFSIATRENMWQKQYTLIKEAPAPYSSSWWRPA